MNILRIEHLSFAAEGRSILNDLSMAIEQGIVHSILGPNAAGKSTLAAVLMGCNGYSPQSGKVFFRGEEITHLPIHERARRGLTLAWQEPARFEGLSVKDYLAVGGNPHDPSLPEEALRAVLLEPGQYLNRPVDRRLSGGERKRIELAAILTMRPRLAILDEPDSGIDILALDHIVELILELKRRGTTVLLITHRQEVAEIADRCSLLCSGLLMKEGTPREVGRYFKQKCVPCPSKTPEVEGERRQEGEPT